MFHHLPTILEWVQAGREQLDPAEYRAPASNGSVGQANALRRKRGQLVGGADFLPGDAFTHLPEGGRGAQQHLDGIDR